MRTTLKELSQLFQEHVVSLLGDTEQKISGISSIENITNNHLTYCLNRKYLDQALESSAAAIVLTPQLYATIENNKSDKNFCLSEQPELLVAKILHHYIEYEPKKVTRARAIHETAQISASANISTSAIIEAYTVIGDGVEIGDDCYIGPHNVIHSNSSIGANSYIQAQCFINSSTKIGSHCSIGPQTSIGTEAQKYTTETNDELYKFENRHPVIIEDYVDIGAQSILDQGLFKNTQISKGSKIDNHCHIGPDCFIGENNLITAGLLMTGFSRTGSFCIFGGNTTIFEHVRITDRVQIAGMSVITEDVSEPGVYGGHPLQPLNSYLKTLSCISKLPKLEKAIKQLI